ncbi:MAG: GGDEF domain-containing protein [Bacilli bacterium]|nr:GGDEF domain-containing protein [Bacilli bacterium]
MKKNVQKVLTSQAFSYAFPLAVLSVLALVFLFFRLPNGSLIMVVALASSVALFGFGPSSAPLAITLGYALYAHSIMEGGIANHWVSLLLTCFGSLLLYFLIGDLHLRHQKVTKSLQSANETLRQDNSALLEVSHTDELTRAKNRLALRTDYEGYIGKSLCVAMVDIDNFKSINDEFGHPTGDHILRKVTRAIKGAFGDSWCYRYGGDEFLIIFPCEDESRFEEGLRAIENIVTAPATVYHYDHVSMSIGYVYGHCVEEDDLRLMIAASDMNLYLSKDSGKARHYGEAYDKAKTLSSLRKQSKSVSIA